MTAADDTGGPGALRNPDPAVVTVWSDIGCPWASLALRTLHDAVRERGRQLLVDHRAFPLELFNRMPTPKYIVDAEIVVIAGACPELGWRMWHAPESSYPVTTLPALEAVQAAKAAEVGGLRASDELDGALREAFYVRNQCISVHSVVLDVAAACPAVDERELAAGLARGAGRAEVYAQWEVARRPEVQGSPQLFASGERTWHNPGAVYHWTAPPPEAGFPRLVEYRDDWARELLDTLG